MRGQIAAAIFQALMAILSAVCALSYFNAGDIDTAKSWLIATFVAFGCFVWRLRGLFDGC